MPPRNIVLRRPVALAALPPAQTATALGTISVLGTTFSSPSDWDAMRASLTLSPGNDAANIVILDNYYLANTGYLSAVDGNPGTLLAVGSPTVTSAWLTANQNGTNIYQAGGRWYLDGVSATRITVGIDNLTIRRSLIDFNNNTGGYAIAFSNNFGRSYGGLLVEHCTLTGGSVGTSRICILAQPSALGMNIRYCDIGKFRVGIYTHRWVNVHHCYGHDTYYTSGSHNEDGLIYGTDTSFTQCYLTSGNSAALAIYADFEALTNLTVNENIFRTDIASYAINSGSGKVFYGASGAGNTLTDNVFFLTPEVNTIVTPGYRYISASGMFPTRTGNTYIDGTAI